MEAANEMSKSICEFTNSNYGIGITGKLNRVDRFNKHGDDNIVYISIYDNDNNKYYNDTFKCIISTREENKKLIIDKVIKLLKKLTDFI